MHIGCSTPPEAGSATVSFADFATVRMAGYVTCTTLAAAARTLFCDPAWPSANGVLLDARDVSPLALCPIGMNCLECALAELCPSAFRGNTAVVTGRDEDICMMALLFKVKAQGCFEVGVFVDLDDALAWIGERSKA